MSVIGGYGHGSFVLVKCNIHINVINFFYLIFGASVA